MGFLLISGVGEYFMELSWAESPSLQPAAMVGLQRSGIGAFWEERAPGAELHICVQGRVLVLPG